MSVTRTPRDLDLLEDNNRYALIDGYSGPRLAYLDASEDACLTPERREEIRALAILANDRVRMRNESEAVVGDVDLWANFGRHAEDISEIVWFRPETGIAYIRTTGCWEGRVLAADIGVKPMHRRG